MKRAGNARSARQALDRRLLALGPADRYATPPRGWVRAVRDALGMTTTDLGTRLGITAQSVSSLEESERLGRVRLDTLARAARAMDCTLVYTLIPNRGLGETEREQALKAAARHAGDVRHSMGLEDQRPDVPASSIVEALADELTRTGRVWRAP